MNNDARKKIKLLHVTSSLKVGGAERLLADLVSGLGTETFEHHVIYFHDGPVRLELERNGIAVYHVQGMCGLYDPVFWLRLWRCFSTIKPDVVHALLWSAIIAARVISFVKKIPIVCVYHNNVDQNGVIRNVADWLTIGMSTRLVAVSDQVADSMHRLLGKKLLVSVIKNGIDSNNIVALMQQQAQPRSALGLSDTDFVIGAVGRLVPLKNFSLLIRVYAELSRQYPSIKLVLVGQGPEEQALRWLAQQLGVAQTVLFVVGASAYGYYPLFDVFVQTTDKEGISMALLEALSAGVACVVTNIDRHHPVITHNDTGIVVPAQDSQALSDAIGKLVSDRKHLALLAARGKTHVKSDFDRENMIKAYASLYRSLAQKYST